MDDPGCIILDGETMGVGIKWVGPTSNMRGKLGHGLTAKGTRWLGRMLPLGHGQVASEQVPFVMRRGLPGHPLHILGRVTVDKMEFSDSRVPDMHLGSHTITGATIMEQSKDFLLRDGQQIFEGCDDPGKSYISKSPHKPSDTITA